MFNGQVNGSLGGRVQMSPQQAKRRAAGRRRQEARWAARRPSWEQVTPATDSPSAPEPDTN